MKSIVGMMFFFVCFGCGSTRVNIVEDGNPQVERVFRKLMNASPSARANDIRLVIVEVIGDNASALHTPALSVHFLGTGSVVMWTTKMLEEPKDLWPFVMGHEIAHALLTHALVFGREHSIELYADRIGFQLATSAGYDPSRLVKSACRFFQKMDRLGGFSEVDENRRTHPDAKIRCSQLKTLLERKEFDTPTQR